MNSKQIQNILRVNFNHDYVLENQFVFYWESDYFGITKSGYVWEIEVKVSVSDFKADFLKNFKHRCLRFNKQNLVAHENQEVFSRKKVGMEEKNGRMVSKYEDIGEGFCRLIYGKNIIPNRFFYAVPSELAEKVKTLVPKYAGLLSIDDKNHIFEIKKAPLLHKEKLFEQLKTTLLSKFYWLSERQRKELNSRQRMLGYEL